MLHFSLVAMTDEQLNTWEQQWANLQVCTYGIIKELDPTVTRFFHIQATSGFLQLNVPLKILKIKITASMFKFISVFLTV